ncbi:hypothetical protein B9N43_11105 [Denitratisoma sp. DHT3]|uniref:hypothetical protein n=1 Tax=Denitratisoma sp. DHT3 TaxID=1981880 RepID=UPI0011989C10|nr:hypothetical protein [Denitratisoma sp. DHT3]QDX81751.1 hypothetical protein B9N43_11105 [Denitratisoma sp. DHT3]
MMNATTLRNPRVLILALTLLMALTRSHHWAGLHTLPDASWAVFFLGGAVLGSLRAFAGLCALAAAIDWAAIVLGGVSGFCVTPAYAMLLPAYAALWLGGRWYARQRRGVSEPWAALVLAVLLSALVAELCSSGGFYFFGGRYADPTLAGFLPRLVRYFPPMLGTMACYVGLAVAAWAALSAMLPRQAAARREDR